MAGKHEAYTFKLVSAITSTFDEDSEHFIATTEELDATEFFTSILTATTYVFNELTGDNKNNVEMTHVLNGLAVQQAVKSSEGTD